ncbi:MAG TPA: hypothetical protein VG651_16255 [Stellaceae bacterium]|nr:hypothetical protein [Stellaceae bacterium]
MKSDIASGIEAAENFPATPPMTEIVLRGSPPMLGWRRLVVSMALGASLVAGATPARAQNLVSPLSSFNQSQQGGAGGGAGPTINVTNATVIGTGQTATRPLIDLSSTGGSGNPAGCRGGGRRQTCSGAGRGGAGGNVTFIQGGQFNVAATDQSGSSPVPLIELRSIGGRGGRLSGNGNIQNENGGPGGTVSLAVNTSFGTQGSDYIAARLLSEGGPGAVGGLATIQTASTATVSTNGTSSPGIIAQSLGGAGGGGRSFAGSTGGRVEATTNGTITTQGDRSIALLLESVGGRGGEGTRRATNSAGGGGGGGTVTAQQNGTISTRGDYSYGIVAQSVGGTGGNGGRGIIGQNGGAAGSGGAATVINAGTVTTQGGSANAVVAQSIGGGRALDALTIETLGADGPGGGRGGAAAFPFFARGGAGGTGGNGGAVTARDDGTIATAGDDSYGILAQSIGGSGGTAGGARSLGLAFSLSLGGNGGGGGAGGNVTIERATTTNSSITTSGANASAIFAQSVGGGGGAGGDARTVTGGVKAGLAIAIGGNGGPGGNGGNVSVDNASALNTSGAGAEGIETQSVGGGGGDAGKASATTIAASVKGPAAAFSLALGGSGGKGGNGGVVDVTNGAAITTSGDYGYGMSLRSIGGGGGGAGAASAYSLAASASSPALNLSNAVGGSGGDGGIGSTVFATNNANGTISTTGDYAIGIIAESVGGGGGDGGGAEAIGNALSKRQNINITNSVGGTGGKGGSGGEVTVVDAGQIETEGKFADGIVAQSIGGGGGNGGSASALATTGLSFDRTLDNLVQQLPLADTASASLTIGGKGGAAGTGSAVSVTNNGSIATFGSDANAIFAQSVGGGGGTGGAVNGSAQGKLSLSLTLGGDGGNGNAGGSVTVTNNKTITTAADGSHGIFAQSIGGSGGTGGSVAPREDNTPDRVGNLLGSIKTAIGLDTFNNLGLNQIASDCLQLGQFIADLADPAYQSLLDTLKSSAFGTRLQSATSAVNAKKGGGVPDVSGTLAIGGLGGNGGVGGTVNVTNAGTITTAGAESYGIYGESVGGGGGEGGLSETEAGNKKNLTVNLGGKGGDGNLGGLITVTNSGTIGTGGDVAYGIFAQSVGGGGGNGVVGGTTSNEGMSLSVTLGGTGGRGGNGGAVTVNNTGAITTQGKEAIGILAQSIGGGGGDFSAPIEPDEPSRHDGAQSDCGCQQLGRSFLSALGLNLNVPSLPAVDLSSRSGAITLGGSGGAAGDGGAVNVVLQGSIQTAGAGATGINAQSIGGGGGMAELAAGPGGGAFTLTLGGSGGAAGGGGTVQVAVNAGSSITTGGDDAVGLMAQSVGGGGGEGGAYQMQVAGVQVLNGTLASSLKIGGNGSEGAGGNVTATVNGPIVTSGYLSHGVVAQSIGGGGGYSATPVASLSLGQARARGNSNQVTVATQAPIQTSGNLAIGIIAQSVSGGGGIGVGQNTSAGGAGSVTFGSQPSVERLNALRRFGRSLGIGRTPMQLASGNAGAVNVTVGGPITTSGAGAVGVVAQSVGGGGGIALSSGALTPSFVKGNGNGGNVTVTVDAPIVTTGANAVGVVAESIGGGGGIVIDSNGVLLKGAGGSGGAGKVSVVDNKPITATGPGAVAIKLKSGSDPTVTIAPEATVTGGAGGAGVQFDGPGNVLVNNGQLDDASGYAVQSLSGDTAITNNGTMNGAVQLTTGAANSLVNTGGATLLVGSLVDLGGTGNVLTNQGTLGISQPGTGTALINGSLAETPSSTLVVRLDTPRKQWDAVTITGAAQLAGAIQPIEIDKGHLRTGTFQESEVLTAQGGVTSGPITVIEPRSVIEQFSEIPTATGFGILSLVDFAPVGLDAADRIFATYEGQIQDEGGSPLFTAITAALVDIPTVSALGYAYEAIDADGVSIVPQAKIDAVSSAMNVVVDRLDGWLIGDAGGPTPGTDISPLSQAGTGWNRGRVWGTLAAGGTSGSGLSGNAEAGTFGVDAEPEGWPVLVGGAITASYGTLGLTAPNSSNSSTDYGAMLYGIYRAGPAYVSAVAYGGGGQAKYTRNLYSLGLPLATNANFTNATVGGRIETGYRFDLGTTAAGVTPFAALAPVEILQNGATENFAGYGPGMTYRATNITSLPSYLGVKFDGMAILDDAAMSAPFARIAWMHDARPQRNVPRNYAELPSEPFEDSTVPTVGNAAAIRLGLGYRLRDNVQLTASVDAQLSGAYQQYGGSLALRVAW